MARTVTPEGQARRILQSWRVDGFDRDNAITDIATAIRIAETAAVGRACEIMRDIQRKRGLCAVDVYIEAIASGG